jgi:hypothetical protein
MLTSRVAVTMLLVLQAGCATLAGSGARVPEHVIAMAGCYTFHFSPATLPGLHGMPPERATLEARRVPSSLRRGRWYAATADAEVPNARLNHGHWVMVESERQLQIAWGDMFQSVTLDFLIAETPSVGQSLEGMARSYSDDGMESIYVPVTMIRVRCDGGPANAHGGLGSALGT